MATKCIANGEHLCGARENLNKEDMKNENETVLKTNEGGAEFTIVKKMYLHDYGYSVSIANNKEVIQSFKNVFISDNDNNNDPNYWMSVRVNKDTEIEDMRIAMLMTNSIEMASLCIDLCSWVEGLSITHGVEDDKAAYLVKQLRGLARPKI